MSNKPSRLGDPALATKGAGIAKVLGEAIAAEPVKKAPSEELPATQGKKGQKRLRLNVSFTEANKNFLTRITRLQGVSVAEYINGLIAADRVTQEEKLQKIADLLGKQ